MPPKAKKEKCELCTQELKPNDEVLQCAGTCKARLHRYCASVTVTNYKKITDLKSVETFTCLCCSHKDSAAEISRLQNEVDSLKQTLAQVLAALSPAHENDGAVDIPRTSETHSDKALATSTYAGAVHLPAINRAKTATPGAASKSSVSPSERKFNLVVYGIKESKKGTPKHKRMSNDLVAASEIINKICPDITGQAIRDCLRLGKYTEGRNRPTLMKLNRSWDVLSILANRSKLASTPEVSIKPHQSPKERATESTLLRQRWTLMQSGVEKSLIKIRGDFIYVNNKKYGKANESEFTLYAQVDVADESKTGSDSTQTNLPS